jgi:RNA recognition motif-containing protein
MFSFGLVTVIREKDGRVFGFVRFTDVNDQREALIHMNGFNGLGLGERPIKVDSLVLY